MDSPPQVIEVLKEVIDVEARSAPEGGVIESDTRSRKGSIIFTMESEDPSTLRAMLNSYGGLISAAARTTTDGDS
jgi:tRNA threonylcarbamoyladenosine modification (KEOPS) complex  Pcc1 subunit